MSFSERYYRPNDSIIACKFLVDKINHAVNSVPDEAFNNVNMLRELKYRWNV